MSSLQFKGKDPGAVMLGNFINYYQFHPPEHRVKHFPTHLWKRDGGKNFVCLDIGCNTGELTECIFQWISKHFEKQYECETQQCSMLACDIDPTLITRAREGNQNQHIQYECVDFMNPANKNIPTSFLEEFDKKAFDVIFCFSVTMWIHLNHGDEGLKRFLEDMCNLTNMLVIEPQPWKCYQAAARRLRKCGESFPHLKNLKMRHSVDRDIETFLTTNCSFHKVYETPLSLWGRRVLFYQKHCD